MDNLECDFRSSPAGTRPDEDDPLRAQSVDQIYKTASLYDLIMLSVKPEGNQPVEGEKNEPDYEQRFIQNAVDQQTPKRLVLRSAKNPTLAPAKITPVTQNRRKRVSRAERSRSREGQAQNSPKQENGEYG